ncbi:Uncharacterised protein [uncultured archaeon]|nr:Uncharacterised protein [uncultured archaeon]
MDINLSIQLLILAAIAIIYAAFDVFNKRNVPNAFAYVSIVVGIAVTFLLNQGSIAYSFLIAIAIIGVGHVIYKMGFWGAGDYFELASISMIIPVQFTPLLIGTGQLGLPFILSVFIATGLVAVWVVPVYYLLLRRNEYAKAGTDSRHIFYGLTLMLLYLAMSFMVYGVYGLDFGKLLLIVLIAVPSAITLTFEERITSNMIRFVGVEDIEADDIIALNVLEKSEIARLSKKYDGFGRLVTEKFLGEFRGSKEKLPVYRNAAPLAAFILAGAAISVLFGNIILLML